jgi:hypothetical protein
MSLRELCDLSEASVNLCPNCASASTERWRTRPLPQDGSANKLTIIPGAALAFVATGHYLFARANSRKLRAGFPATAAFGGIDFVTTAPAEILVPEPTMSGFPGLPLTIVAPAPTKASCSITTWPETVQEGQSVT